MQQVRRSPRGLSAVSREGSALLVVLVVIVLLSLAAYSYSEKMVLEAEASEFAAQQAQARAAADSGIEYAAAILGGMSDSEEPVNLYHDPSVFAGVAVPAAGTQGTSMFTLVAPVETDSTAQQVRCGLMDESGKLNLNTVVSFQLEDEELRNVLLQIPGMTEEAADSILDWIDEDSDPREFGAENDVYEAMTPSYTARNGPMESLDELLLVNGVTPQLLYGEDANRNGLLDPNEDDGSVSLPVDNADGMLDFGWAAYFTVSSRESNLRSDGEARIDVNGSVLVDLYDALEEALGPDEAQFIVAYRMFGATNVEPLEDASGSGSTGVDVQTSQALQNMASGISQQISGNNTKPVIKGGMDLSQGPSVDIESLYELIDAKVDAVMSDGTTSGKKETLSSPWTSDQTSLSQAFPLLLDAVTTYSGDSIDGRVNINQARYEVLMAIPNMEAQLADSIINSQQISSDGQPLTTDLALRQTPAWLLAKDLADITMMRRLDPYITARGSVYRLQVLGHFDGKGPIARVDAVIDATSYPPRVTGRRDLSGLGPGYDVQTLLGTGNN